MPELRLSEAARLDLDELQDEGLATFGTEAIRKHMAGFDRVFSLLRDFPLAGQERPEYGAGIRSFSHRPHRLLYQVDEEGVLIVRVIHQRQDVTSLPGDAP